MWDQVGRIKQKLDFASKSTAKSSLIIN